MVQSVIVMAPAVPIIPKVSLIAPSTISMCDSLPIDASGSVGHGGRPWTSILWTVLESRSTGTGTVSGSFD
jgi:hypothetical protein